MENQITSDEENEEQKINGNFIDVCSFVRYKAKN